MKQKAMAWKCNNHCPCKCHTREVLQGSHWDHPHPMKRCADVRRTIIKEEIDAVEEFLNEYF